MKTVYLIGERDHTAILEQIKSLVSVKSISEKVDALSLELNSFKYQPLLDSRADSSAFGPYAQIVQFVYNLELPVYATDSRCGLEPKLQSLEKEMHSLPGKLKADLISEIDARKFLKSLIEEYCSLSQATNSFSDIYTSFSLLCLFTENPFYSIAHIGGEHHQEGLSYFLRKCRIRTINFPENKLAEPR